MQPFKPIAFGILFIWTTVIANAQSLWHLNRDSLLNVLPRVYDSTRINCLNSLGVYYVLSGKKDSALFFADLAKNESSKLYFSRGIAESLTTMGACEVDFTKQYSVALKYLTEALQWFNKTDNKGNIGFNYYKLGHTFHTIGKYKEANFNYKLAISSFRRNNDLTGISRTLFFISNVYLENGEYDSAFQYLKEGVNFSNNNYTDSLTSLFFLGNFYSQVSDYETSLEYYRELYIQKIKLYGAADVEILNKIGRVLGLNNKYDSALYYFEKAKTIEPTNRQTEVGIGEIFLMQGAYNEALDKFEEPYNYYTNINNVNEIMRLQLDIGRAFSGKAKYEKVYQLGHKLLDLSKKTGARQYRRDGYELLSTASAKLAREDSAYFYLQKYTVMKDSVINQQILWRVNNFKKEVAEKSAGLTIALLQKDNSLKNQQLKRESLIKNIFFFGILLVLILGLIVFRFIVLKRKSEMQRREVAENALRIEKLENEKEQSALKHKATELEMMALQLKSEKEMERIQLIAQQKSELEDKVALRTAELEKSLTNLKATQAQLIQSEKMASLGELTAGIAHEIQNPLNFVNNFSEVNKELLAEMKDEIEKGNLFEAKTIAEDVIENQEKINQHGKRADAIVKGMLQHSQIGSGIKELTDINSITDEYLKLAYHSHRIKDKSVNISTKTSFDMSIDMINIIPQDIGRVLLNLFNNAFYTVSEKNKLNINGYLPTVTLSTKRIGDKVEISVKDNGMGIPDKVKDKIFQPFFTTKPSGQGTGLGLSLSYDIIRAHQGDIKVDSKEGEFTEFLIQLPA